MLIFLCQCKTKKVASNTDSPPTELVQKLDEGNSILENLLTELDLPNTKEMEMINILNRYESERKDIRSMDLDRSDARGKLMDLKNRQDLEVEGILSKKKLEKY